MGPAPLGILKGEEEGPGRAGGFLRSLLKDGVLQEMWTSATHCHASLVLAAGGQLLANTEAFSCTDTLRHL